MSPKEERPAANQDEIETLDGTESLRTVLSSSIVVMRERNRDLPLEIREAVARLENVQFKKLA